MYSLDSGWRFWLESVLPRAHCVADAFPLSLLGRRCPGLLEQPLAEDGGPASAEECRVLCCSSNESTAWQWCEHGVGCSAGAPCWCSFDAGAAGGNCSAAAGWVGGVRTAAQRRQQVLEPCDRAECQVSFDDHSWRELDVPHDFVVEGNFSREEDKSHGFLPLGVAWYRRHFFAPAAWERKSVFLDFDGVMAVSQVWLNGVVLGGHGSGYTPFRFELGAGTAAAAFVSWGGDNVVAVRVSAMKPDSWWYDGGGIYRHVFLRVMPLVHISNHGVYAPAVVGAELTGVELAADAEMRPSVEVENAAISDETVSVSCRVYDAQGKLVGESVSAAVLVKPRCNLTVKPPPIPMASAELWSLARPTLYVLSVDVVKHPHPAAAREYGSLVDTLNVSFGVRSVRWDAESGFELNGAKTKILGCANHQDFAAVGVAVPDLLQEHRMRMLKGFGGNAWRTAHNPPNDALLDAADRLGVLVWDENHRNGEDAEMDALVRRDRNHPSVIIWSLCNEVLCNTDQTVADARRLKQIAQRLDPFMGRVISANSNDLNGPDTPLDLQGLDYGTEQYDKWHTQAPHVPAIGSEVSSAVSDRGEYADDALSGHVSGFDSRRPPWGETAEVAWQAILDRSFIAGGFTWTGWDYRGEPTPYAWPDVGSHFGIIDSAGFWKDRTHWYHAWWTRPVPAALHIFPHWNWSPDSCHGACRAVGAQLYVDVWAYSNAEAVELWHPNGSSLGRRTMKTFSHVEWKAVPYVAGSLVAAAYVGGAPAVTRHVRTTGIAARLRLYLKDGVGSHGLVADGRDVALVVAEVVDASGDVVPTAANIVNFSCFGGIVVGTGNGDPADHTRNTSPTRPAYHGLALAVLRVGRDPVVRSVTITASSQGLADASLTLPVASPLAASSQGLMGLMGTSVTSPAAFTIARFPNESLLSTLLL